MRLTVGASFLVALVNVVIGMLIAWVLVRDEFPGKRIVDTLIDLPFALPTIVAGLVLLSLYGVNSPLGVDLAYTRAGVVVALLFVTLPFVVRTVQPVLHRARPGHGGGGGVARRRQRSRVPADRPAQPAAGHLGRHRPGLRPRHQRVRVDGADLREHAVQDPGRGVHIFGQIETDNTQRGRGGGDVSCWSWPCWCSWASTCCSGGRRAVRRRTGPRIAMRLVALAYLSLLLIMPVGLVFWRTFENGVGPVLDALTSPSAMHAFKVTAIVAAWTVVLNTVFGVGAALLLVRHRFRGQPAAQRPHRPAPGRVAGCRSGWP